MKTLLKSRHLILIPETDAERLALAAWREAREGDVFGLAPSTDDELARGLALKRLGPSADVCHEPINVISTASDERVALISNLAPASFVLDGREYASVEGFWQGLKFSEPAERHRVAQLAGLEAKRAGAEVAYGATLEYEGRVIVPGTWSHWQLMHAACWAKFSQFEPARAALLSTRERPLAHVVRHDSHTIPGAIMATIWMKIRTKLRGQRSAAHG